MDTSRAAVAWIAGLLLASRWPLPPALPAAAVGLSVPLALFCRRRPGGAAVAVLLLCLVLGALRQSLASGPLPPDHVSALNDRGAITLRGWIAGEPERRDWGTQYRVAVEQVRTAGGWARREGLVLAQAPRFPEHCYGAAVVVTGRLQTPPAFESFDYRAWLGSRGVHSLVRRATVETVSCCRGAPARRVLIAARDAGRRALAAALPEPEASLAAGIVLGDAHGLPAKVDAAFRATNTTHVIAISGSNVALVLGVVLGALSRWLGRRRAVPAALVALLVYTALVGADASVVRAAAMGSVALVGNYLGRPAQALGALLVVAWAMTAYRPAYLQDLGFQLSFAATVGLIALSPPLTRAADAAIDRLLGPGRLALGSSLAADAVLATVAAQLATWPVIARQVGQISITGLFANFLIVPVQSAVMVLGSAVVLAGSAWEPLGKLLGMAAWLPLAYTVRVVEATASLPMASIRASPPDVLLLGYYVALAAAVQPESLRVLAGLRSRLGQARRPDVRAGEIGATLLRLRASRWPLLGAAAACVLAWAAADARPDGLLHLRVLDVGQGDAILIDSPSGRRLLVDGGPSPSAVLDGLGRALPPWDRRLDVVVLSHPDDDHIGGLPAVLERYRVSEVVEGRWSADTPTAGAWRQAVAAEGARRTEAVAGTVLEIDRNAGTRAIVLWPPAREPNGSVSANNRSMVLMLEQGAVRMLLAGDIEEPAESWLATSGADLHADVLKVAHHGSDTSTSPAFLSAVRPSLALISVGAGNGFGHPSPNVLARLASVEVARTDWHGPIEVLSDGAGVWRR